jgi:hypothetical protein
MKCKIMLPILIGIMLSGLVAAQEYTPKHFVRDELVTEIAHMQDLLNNGACFSHWGYSSMPFEHQECLNAQSEAFDLTGDIEYLDAVTTQLESQYADLQDCQDVSKAWPEYPQFINDSRKEWRCQIGPHDWLSAQKFAQSYAKYVSVVYKNNITSHLAFADKYKDWILNDFLGEMMETWQEYDANGETRGCFGYDQSGRPECAPHNRVSGVYDILLYANEWTGNQSYVDIYTKWAKYREATFQHKVAPDGKEFITWGYADDDSTTTNDYDVCEDNPTGWSCIGSGEMGSYMNFDLQPILHGYKLGIYFNDSHLQYLANLLNSAAGTQANVYDNNGVLNLSNAHVINWEAENIEPTTWQNDFILTSNTWGWVDLSMFSVVSYDKMEEIFHNEYYHQKSNDTFWRNSIFQHVANPLADPNTPISGNGQTNPAWTFYGLVKLLAYTNNETNGTVIVPPPLADTVIVPYGEVQQLPQLTSSVPMDNEGGQQTILACSYTIDSIEQEPTEMTTELCPESAAFHNFTSPEVFHVRINYGIYVFNTTSGLWELSSTGVADEKTIAYELDLPSIPVEMIDSLMELFKGLICSIPIVSDWFGFCQA